MSVKFNSCFRVANEVKHRYKVMLGSAGSGKSRNIAQDYIVKLIDPKYKGCSLLVVRSAEVSHINSTFAELLGVINSLGINHLWKIRVSPISMKCITTGNEIIFRGCNDQRSLDRLKSVTVSEGAICWCWIEEATEIRQSDFEVIDDRLRGILDNPNLYYQICLSFNPVSSSHWIKKTLWDYESDNIFKHKSTYFDNKFIDEAYKERMRRRKDVDPQGYEVYALGNWGETGGLIFNNVKIGDYSSITFDSYSLGADWGYSHLTAITLFGHKDGDIYALKEVVARQKTTREIIQMCDNAGIPKDVLMYCDCAEPDRIKEFSQAGYKVIPVKKEPNSVKNQITWLKNRTIYVDGRCNNLHREILQYKYIKDSKTGEYTDEPVPYEDDSIASMRYAIESHRKSIKLQSISKGAFNL